MAWTRESEETASQVLSVQALCLIFTFLNSIFVYKELKQRYHGECTFKSRALQYLSLLSIIGGFLHSATRVLSRVDGFCYFTNDFSNVVALTHPIIVGLYQLTRLYQSFVQNPNGYPKSLFIAMGTFAVVYSLTMFIIVYIRRFTIYCHSISDYGFALKWKTGFHHESVYVTLLCIGIVLYSIWDLTTLLLFVFKVRDLTTDISPSCNRDEERLINIRRNITRIVILTIFYMMPASIASFTFLSTINIEDRPHGAKLVEVAVYRLQSTVMSYAVYLMLPHNSEQYGRFLKWIIALKLHFCFCRYRLVVERQSQHFLFYENMNMILVDNASEDTKMESATAPNENSVIPTPSQRARNWSDHRRHRKDSSAGSLSIVYEQENDGNGDKEDIYTTTPGEEGTATTTIQIVYDKESDSNNHNGNGAVVGNDFLYENTSETGGIRQYSNGFSFGLYLEYWRPNRHNTVKAKCKSLEEEIVNNKHAPVSRAKYKILRKQCSVILSRRKVVAKDVGIMNKICKIKPGTPITLDHVIAIKLYTDFDSVQMEFKRHCRRLHPDESIENVMERNSEIAIWCRRMRECIMFFGDTMTTKEVVFCGLSGHLIFKSLYQRFECPLSTSLSKTVATKFADRGGGGVDGVVLKLKMANPKTRYLHCGPYSVHKKEEEKLFMGSTLKIIDILIGRYFKKSLKRFVSALTMLEQIVNGHFMGNNNNDGDGDGMALLLMMIHQVVSLSMMDAIKVKVPGLFKDTDDQEEMVGDGDYGEEKWFLDDQGYDTDAVIDDAEDEEDSNIMERMDKWNEAKDKSEFLRCVRANHGGSETHSVSKESQSDPKSETNPRSECDETTLSNPFRILTRDLYDRRRRDPDSNSKEEKEEEVLQAESVTRVLDPETDMTLYEWLTFGNFMEEIKIKKRRGTLWLNDDELNKEEFAEIKEALLGDGQLFDYMQIDKEDIPRIQQYEWLIDGVEYETLKTLGVSEYKTSPSFEYGLNGEFEISFHFRFYSKYIDGDSPQCAIFMEIDGMSEDLKRVRVEVDIKCVKKEEYRQLMRSRVFTKNHSICGFECFDYEELERNESMKWVFSVKMFKAEKEEVEMTDDQILDLHQIFV